ncbi:MAG: hypothetical protein ABSE59_07150, partial [Opitutaceae bacterium]
MSKNSRAREAAKTTNRVVPPIGPNVFVVNGRVLLAGSIVALAALAVYLNSFSGPFILDDAWSITTNPSIHRFGTAFSPPPDKGVGGRPLLNLTFAVNYALSGLSVGSYHVFNLLIHALAGLTLFGIVRRTLLEPPTPTSDHSIVQQPIFRKDATWLALAVAVIWMVHPLQTEAVTYISQRAESLMGLFYLLTLYCFVRSAERRSREPRVQSQEPDPSVAGIGSQRSTLSSRLGSSASGICPLSSALWLLASVVSCLLGMMSKEVIVTAPVMVFLYDRTF